MDKIYLINRDQVNKVTEGKFVIMDDPGAIHCLVSIAHERGYSDASWFIPLGWFIETLKCEDLRPKIKNILDKK